MDQLGSSSESGDLTEHMEKAFAGAKTIGGCFRSHYERNLAEFWAKLPEGDPFRRRFLRYWEPWPDWAVRCVVEVWSVFFPKISKDLIWDSLRFLHWLVFEARFDGNSPVGPPPIAEIDAFVAGTLVGHALAMPGYLRGRLDDALKTGAFSKQQHADFVAKHAKQLSDDELLREMQPYVGHYFSTRPAAWAQFSEAMALARRKTLDERGNLRETTLTSVYSRILRDWPEIEEMSGPTELCAFLDPLLVGSKNDPDKKLDRVKKICRRVGITFRPVVKGRTV